MAEEKHVKVLTIISLYGIAVAALYHFGFWSTFGIDVLQYIGISDIIKLAAYPISCGLAVAAIAALVNSPFFISNSDSNKKTETPLQLRIDMYLGALVVICAVSGLISMLIYGAEQYRWEIVGIILSVATWLLVRDISILSALLPNPQLRKILLKTLSALLVGAFFLGKFNSHRILQNDCQFVPLEIFKEREKESFAFNAFVTTTSKGYLKYIGAAGDYFFFLSPDNAKTFVVKNDAVYFLELSNTHQ